MDKYFRTEDGRIVDLIDHCGMILGENPNSEILIGCDSQNGKKKGKGDTEYVVTVVFRHGTKGAHFIYKKVKVPKIRDLFTRLFKECEFSLEAADIVTKNSAFKVGAIELDYNDFKRTKSAPLVSATKGWCESQGYKVVLKSGDMFACKAADHVLRHPGLYK